MSDYMACARNIGVAINDKFAILPAERSGIKGLYVYTDLGAYFLALGTPRAQDGDAEEFLLKTRIVNIGELLVNFRDKKRGSASNIQPGISYQTDNIPDGYATTPARDALDDGAREVMGQRLREKVATIKNFIDDKNSYSTPVEAKAAFENDRVVYLAKLEQCRISGDRALISAVEDEVQKLKTGFPGATVWEKQIGAKSPVIYNPIASTLAGN